MVRDHLAADVGNVDVGTAVRSVMRARTKGVQMSEAMKERRADRRRGVSSWFTAPVNDRRRPANERRVGETVHIAPGAIRPGVGEAVPLVERRRYLDGGME